MERRQSDAAAAGYSPTSWTTNVLPPVELTTEQREKYRVLATQLLSNTLRDYDIYSADPRQRRMSRRRWKPVKTRDHITVYKERYPTPSPLGSSNRLVGQPSRTSRASFADRVSMAFKSNEWTEPKLLVATGWIEGTLDDVMYGVASPDAQSMLVKATVVKNTLINGAVLACIDAPCSADPFRFLGVKWFVKGPPTALHGIVRPRDLVFIEATGITTRPNGERVGYQLLHSVDPPQYRDMMPRSGMDVTRGRISSCSIFREMPAGLGSRHSKVDVYVKGYVEAHGKLLDSVALTAASTGFMSSWNTVECANLKKLMWCFRQLPDRGRDKRRHTHKARRSSRRSHASSSVSCPSRSHHDYLDASVYRSPRGPESLSQESPSSCGTCTKRLGKLVNGAISCGLCSQDTCARCRVSRTLKEANNDLWLRQEEVLICKRCVLRVDHLAAVDVARAEVQVDCCSRESKGDSSFAGMASFASTGVTTDTGASILTLPTEEEYSLSVLSPSADQPMDSFRGIDPGTKTHEDIPEHEEDDDKVEKVVLSDRERREQIWSQMVELRMVAESIYKLTLETTESLNATPQRTPPLYR
uniref:FYVE-type domain-containing protein n=1 Tax=Phytophthora ramorum TaxID=164328 RepID=H3GDG5_PHYRM